MQESSSTKESIARSLDRQKPGSPEAWIDRSLDRQKPRSTKAPVDKSPGRQKPHHRNKRLSLAESLVDTGQAERAKSQAVVDANRSIIFEYKYTSHNKCMGGGGGNKWFNYVEIQPSKRLFTTALKPSGLV